MLCAAFRQQLGLTTDESDTTCAGRKVDAPGNDDDGRADGENAEQGNAMKHRLEAVALVERAIAVEDVDHQKHGQNSRDSATGAP